MIKTLSITKIHHCDAEDAEDYLAVEEPLEIQLQFIQESQPMVKSLSVTMRTPGQDEALAIGFLLTEGIIQTFQDIKGMKGIEENKVLITLTDDMTPSLQKTDRNFYTTSSCGVCGKSSIEAIRTMNAYQHTTSEFEVAAEMLYALPLKIRKDQKTFNTTGGLHAAALFDVRGNLLELQEDVGRHNAMDKLVGVALMKGMLPLSQNILLLSGRTSFELIQKASMAGIKFVAAIGAPSSLAVEMAEEFDMTLIGFLRDDRFNIYSGAKRIKL